jgi:hypothetical protein
VCNDGAPATVLVVLRCKERGFLVLNDDAHPNTAPRIPAVLGYMECDRAVRAAQLLANVTFTDSPILAPRVWLAGPAGATIVHVASVPAATAEPPGTRWLSALEAASPSASGLHRMSLAALISFDQVAARRLC